MSRTNPPRRRTSETVVIDIIVRERAESEDHHWRDGVDWINCQTNFNLPRWVRDKIRAIAYYEHAKQNRLVTGVLVDFIRYMEEERGEPYPYVPLEGCRKEEERGPSF